MARRKTGPLSDSFYNDACAVMIMPPLGYSQANAPFNVAIGAAARPLPGVKMTRDTQTVQIPQNWTIHAQNTAKFSGGPRVAGLMKEGYVTSLKDWTPTDVRTITSGSLGKASADEAALHEVPRTHSGSQQVQSMLEDVLFSRSSSLYDQRLAQVEVTIRSKIAELDAIANMRSDAVSFEQRGAGVSVGRAQPPAPPSNIKAGPNPSVAQGRGIPTRPDVSSVSTPTRGKRSKVSTPSSMTRRSDPGAMAMRQEMQVSQERQKLSSLLMSVQDARNFNASGPQTQKAALTALFSKLPTEAVIQLGIKPSEWANSNLEQRTIMFNQMEAQHRHTQPVPGIKSGEGTLADVTSTNITSTRTGGGGATSASGASTMLGDPQGGAYQTAP